MYFQASKLRASFEQSNTPDHARFVACMVVFREQHREAHEAVQRHLQRNALIALLAKRSAYGVTYPTPVVCVVESGMDCDGVQYSGRRSAVEATPAAVNEHVRRVVEWADGPVSFRIAAIDDESFTYEQRDLTLEAFENGHPHVLHPA